MLSIQTNVTSLIAQQNLNVNTQFQNKTIEQLTSGYRINSSGDDAAGLAVSNGYRDATAELTQGVANGNDAQAQLQIMDGGMSNISQMLDRLQTLAMESASGSFTGNRTTLNSEFQTDLGEINRQAQQIGLNTGGTFAQNMSVYLGAGSGSQSSANSVVNVNLSNAMVDAQSLGLSGVQAVNGTAYDLAPSSSTSVSNILADSSNLNGSTASATFTFVGSGFSNNTAGTANSGIGVTVNLQGVNSTDTLVNAINSAIQSQGNGTTGSDSDLKAANITASIVTNSSGQQQLAFNSSNSSFQVLGTDRMSNALLGNFAADGSSAATGAQMGTTITATNNMAAAGAAGLDMSANNVVLTVSGGGLKTPTNVTLNTDYSNVGNFANQAAVATDITTQLTNAGIANVTASVVGNKLQFATSDGSAITVSASGNATQVTALGMNATASTSAGTSATAGAAYASYAAGGGSQLATSAGAANDLTFTDLGASGSQSITVSADNSSHAAQSLTINLSTNAGSTGSGQDIQHAAAYINQQLQASGNTTLQSVTAVVNNDNGVSKLNFVSTLPSFSVALGNASTSNLGLAETNPSNVAQLLQGVTLKSGTVGTGGSANITTMSGAQAAVTAITGAVSALGSAQAQVGIGENQLNFAVNLAQSEITNFSAAESQIRDSDIAQQAANLSKAQVLQQSSIAAMAQANSAPQAVLSLLKG